jgi:hypothetical protein
MKEEMKESKQRYPAGFSAQASPAGRITAETRDLSFFV